MIVRLLGQGQFDVPEDRLDDLNELDDALIAAIDAGDEESFRDSLGRLLNAVKANAQAVPDDYLGPSDFILPGDDTSLEEVRELLSDEGLIPG